MPNWCNNKLEVVDGSKKFWDFVKDGLVFSSVAPVPAELLNHPSPIKDEELAKSFSKKYGAKDWYDWSILNWGTKWDVEEGDIALSEDSPTCFFNTAWSPPLEFLEKLSSMFPSTEFILDYYEPGVGYAGKACAKKGIVIDNPTENQEEVEQIGVDVFGVEVWEEHD